MEDSTTRNQERESTEKKYESVEERMRTGPVNNRYFENGRDQERRFLVFGILFLVSHF